MRLILLIVWLFAEAWSIAAVSKGIGALPVLVLLLLIAACGSRLIQRQGFRTLASIQQGMARNEVPAVTMLDSVIIFIAGVLLIVPGFFSDVIALILVFSGIRRRLAGALEALLARQTSSHAQGVVIEGEWQDVNDRPDAEYLPRPTDPSGPDNRRP